MYLRAGLYPCLKPTSFLRIPLGCSPINLPDMDSACKMKVSFLRPIYVSFSKGIQVGLYITFTPNVHEA